MIQDLGTFFDEQGKTYHYQHREEPVEGKTRDFAIHDVTVTDSSSLLRKIVGTDVIRDVPSWHHQAVRSVEGTPLKVTAITPTEGIDIIEAVERTDKRFIIGVQYHPEFKSRPIKPHPLFLGFVEAAQHHKNKGEKP